MHRIMIRIARPLALGATCVGLLLGAGFGCGGSGRVTDAPRPDPVVKSPDGVEHTSRSTDRYFAPGNPYVERCVDALLSRRDVSAVVDKFERSGFELTRSECLVLEEEGPEGDARVVILAMLPLSPGVTESVVIACVEVNGNMTIAPGRFATSPGEGWTDFSRVGDNPWLDLTPVDGDVAYMNDLFWERVVNCLKIGVPTVAAGCLVACYFTFQAYPICVVSCVATQALATVVRCYVQVAISTPEGAPRIPTRE